MSISSVSSSTKSRAPKVSRRGPLAGIRVADFCWAGVGAVATRFLADFGAEVIKIEHRNRLDITRKLPIHKGEAPKSYGQEDESDELDPNRSGYFNNCNRNKLGITLDLKHPRGRELAGRLIASSSVVTENFATGVMERLGFDYERLRALRPDVVFVRMSGWGHSGPDAHFHSFGPIAQAEAGMSFISGRPGELPSGWGFSYMDSQGAYYGAIAALMAIHRRQRTGRGTEIDISTNEVGINLLGPVLLEAAVNGRRTRDDDFPVGNRLEHPDAGPHGVYPCVGEDRWVAISVFDDEQWSALVDVMGAPEWTGDERFGTQRGRAAAQDELDALVGEWTSTRDRRELMFALQARGVPAGAVQDAQDLNEWDPQLAVRDVFFELDHPVIGEARLEGAPFQMSRSKPDIWRSSPLLGEDNAHVFKGLLELDESEYAALQEEGVIGRECD